MTPVVYVYELLNASGRHIYVGATKNLQSRLRDHARKWWWADVSTDLTVTTSCGSDAEAAALELALITKHSPEHNKAGRARGYSAYHSRSRRERYKVPEGTRKKLAGVRDLRTHALSESRAAVYAALDANLSIRDVAELTGLSTRTVQDWKASR